MYVIGDKLANETRLPFDTTNQADKTNRTLTRGDLLSKLMQN